MRETAKCVALSRFFLGLFRARQNSNLTRCGMSNVEQRISNAEGKDEISQGLPKRHNRPKVLPLLGREFITVLAQWGRISCETEGTAEARTRKLERRKLEQGSSNKEARTRKLEQGSSNAGAEFRTSSFEIPCSTSELHRLQTVTVTTA